MSSSPFFFKLAVRCSSEFSDKYVRSNVVMNWSDKPEHDSDITNPEKWMRRGLKQLLTVAWAHARAHTHLL